MKPQRIVLVDDHEVVRLGLKALINRHKLMEVVGEAGEANEAVEVCLSVKPDVVILDIRLAGTSGIDACQQIMAQLPETKVVMLTSYAEDEMLFAAIRAGAAGYVLKQAGGMDVIRAIEMAADGKALLDPSVTAHVLAAVRRAAETQDANAFADLSGQERRVLALITVGDTNREIAQRLHLGEGTVRNYVSSIFVKLGVANRAEAAAFATQHRLNDLIDYREAPLSAEAARA
ncbi:MAG: response regulator transcription factor [Anaerolineales bacterium]